MKGLFLTLTAVLFSTAISAQLVSKRQSATEESIMNMELVLMGDLTPVQWFISSPIEMQRELEAEKVVNVDKGRIKIQGGKYWEYVIFTNNATGKIEYKKENIIAIRYEHGDENFLEFKLGKTSASGTVKYYKLSVKEKDGKKYIHYAGDDWQLVSGSRVILEYKWKDKGNNKVHKTKIKGLKNDGTERKSIKLPGKKH